MGLLIVGSVALDTVETPFGRAEEVLGGAATYASLAASLFAPVRVVAVVGEDFPEAHVGLLRAAGVDMAGLQRAAGRTFRWAGRYDFDLNTAYTLDTQLNVFADFRPQLPEAYRDTPYVFLANIDPELQLSVLEQLRTPRLVALDSMNYWIETKREALQRVIARADLLLLNEAEVRQLCGTYSLVRAAREVLAMGPRALAIKKGEHGAVLCTPEWSFFVPGYPLESVKDPTGAGDSFAGGLMGYLARSGDTEPYNLKRGVVHGSVLASFAVEDFSVERLRALSTADIEQRYQEFRALTQF